nr:hypothetical protein BaRGS_027878 [Batillaria attramentaria]
MKADVLASVVHASKANASTLPLILGGVREDEHDKENDSETTEVSKRARRRSKSARKIENGSPTRTESPSSPRNGVQASHRFTPLKSASNNRRNGAPRNVKSRDGKGPTRQDGSPSPQTNFVEERSVGGEGGRVNVRGGGSRQSRRRLRSEEVSTSPDLMSPRSSSSQQQNLFNTTTSSSSSSEDLRLQLSPAPTLARNGGAGQVQQMGAPSPLPPHIAHAWDMFEEHVRNIHDSSDMFSRRQGPSFTASSTFQETMVEIFGYPEYAKPPPPSVTTTTRSRNVTNCATKFILNLRKRTSVVPGAQKPAVREVSRRTIENARRGWRILRQHVHETWLSKRTSTAALSWSMLRQTLMGMSDMDRTRLDLYKRYGIVPSVDSQGRIVMENTMLSDRARKAIANGSRHPLLAHATPQQQHHLPGHHHHISNHPHRPEKPLLIISLEEKD